MTTTGAVIYDYDNKGASHEGVGLRIVANASTPLEALLRSSADASDCASSRTLAIFVAELFAILHPAVLPMLERMFAEVKEDAEIDGESRMKWHAEIGLAAAKIALLEQQALDT